MSKNTVMELTRIIQNASLAPSSKEQVQIIVDAISDVIHIDVCSLYRKTPSNKMILLASHGLASNRPVILGENQGLVGRVASQRHSINIINPEQHPDYLYVPSSKEEEFHSFCGVPLVHHGEVIGVLVVQSRRAELLATEQEAFLSTLGAHLALLIANIPAESLTFNRENEKKVGVSGSPGISIGRIKLIKSSGLNSVQDNPCADIEEEIENWKQLREQVRQELKEERITVERELGDSLASVLDAYQLFLDDIGFSQKIETEIRRGKTLLWAIKQTIRFFSDQFQAMEDPYLQARHEDINALGNKLYHSWQGTHLTSEDIQSEEPVILVGEQITVSDIANLPTEQLAGIICYTGAALSHIAIFSNALGIPAVLGVGSLNVQDGDYVIINADSAYIVLKPSKQLIKEYQVVLKSRQAFDETLKTKLKEPAVTQDGVRIQLFANSGLQADIMPGVRNGADGIGLYRTEIPFMIRQNLPTEDEQVKVYQQVISAYESKPVYIRTLDVGADKPLPYLPHIIEENPALGLRGIRFTLDNLQILLTQFRAIMRAAEGKNNVNVLLPMVGATQELDQSIELLESAYHQLLEEGEPVTKPKIGIMVEVPATISLLPFWKNKIDFVSIGSNDLSQYLLALDRNNSQVAKLYDPLHPAVVHEIKRIKNIADQYEIDVSLCGEMASDPIAVVLLVGMGIRRLSMSSAKIPYIKWLLSSHTIQDAEEFATKALVCDTSAAIRELGKDFVR